VRRRPKRKPKHTLARLLTWLVVIAQASLVAVFSLDPYRPGLIHLPELWAMDRRWQFGLLVGVVAGSATLSAIAWRSRAPVRLTLLVTWMLFVFAMIVFHGPRLVVMIKLIARHG
jgi:hypothetical protein